MTTEQQEELLIGLRTEVLELKEILADNYYDKSQLSDIYITDDDLSSKLKSYLTSNDINNKYKKITESDKRDDELEKLINACALSSQLDDYVTVNDFNDYKSSISKEIKSLEESVTNNSDYIKSKDDIDGMGFIKELPSLDYLASIEWVESKEYLTEHQSLDAYATINWVKTQLESKNINLDAYAKISSIPKRTSDLVNDSGYLTEHQSLSGYAKTEDIDEIKADIYSIKSKFNNYTKNTGYITIKDVESYIGSLNLDGTYAKLSDIDEIVDNLNNYATLTNLSISNVNSKLSKINEGLKDYSTHDYVKDYINNLNISDTYAKKTDIAECDAKIGKVNDNVSNTQSSLTNYIKKSEVSADYVAKSDLETYICSFVSEDDMSSIIDDKMSSYATVNELEKCKSTISTLGEFKSNATTRLSDIENRIGGFVNNIYLLNGKLDELKSSFVSSDELGEYAKKVDIGNFITSSEVITNYIKKSEIYSYIPNLSLYVKNSDINEIKSNIEELTTGILSNTDKIETTNQKLSSNYCTKTEVRTNISKIYSDLTTNLSNYAKKSDINEIKSNIDKLTIGILSNTDKIETTNQKLSSNYCTKTEVRTNISKIYSDLTTNLSNYAKKSDIPESVDLSPYAKTSYVDGIYGELVNYAKLTDIPETTNFVQSNEYNDAIAELYTYIDKRTDYNSVLVDYVTKSNLTNALNPLVTEKEIDNKLSYYLRASSLDDYINSYISGNIEKIVKNYINSQLNVYLTKREAEDTYLAIEDYKYLKSAAVIDDSFKYSYEDFYYSLYDKDGNPLDGVNLHNGFYIVEGTLYFVYNGEFIELEMVEYWKEEEK